MNGLCRIRKDMVITSLMPLKYIIYLSMLADITVCKGEEDGIKYGVYDKHKDLYDFFSEWDSVDSRRSGVLKALQDLSEEGLIMFDDKDPDIIYLGEFRGKKFFTFEVKNSLYEDSVKLLNEEILRYSRSKSAKDKSRSRYIREQVDQLLEKEVDKLQPGDFTELHGLLYEVYTGGEVYNIRNKVEYYQTTNILKAYDKFTTFAIIVTGTLKYDSLRKNGIPTLTNVACLKDDVFRFLTKSDSGSKDYMRDITESISEDTF